MTAQVYSYLMNDENELPLLFCGNNRYGDITGRIPHRAGTVGKNNKKNISIVIMFLDKGTLVTLKFENISSKTVSKTNLKQKGWFCDRGLIPNLHRLLVTLIKDSTSFFSG